MGQKGKITKIPNSQARQNYVVKGATLKCTCGNANSQLQTPGRKSAGIHNNLQANIMDYKPMLNIQPFGYCRSIQNPAVQAATATHHGRLTPAPCMPNTTMPWVFGKQNVIVDGAPAMLDACMNKCLWGGTILISKDGQVMPVSRSVNKERMAQGVDKIANGGLMAMIGLGALAVGLTILTAPVSVPTLLVAASVTTVAAGGACVAMGGSDIAEGEQDVVYGATGSNRNSVNPLRDKVFMGNSEAYGTAEMIVATTAVVGEAGLAPYAATLGGGELAAKKGMTDKTAANKTSNQNVLTDGKNRIAVKKIDARPGTGKNVTSAQGLKAGKVNAVENTKLAQNAATKPVIKSVNSPPLLVADDSFLDETGRIKWPVNRGFDGEPTTIRLKKGTLIDRYGDSSGSYTSPYNTPYEARALPYKNNPDAYHVYKVIKPIDNVTSGKIAPAFKQPGGGIQHLLPDSVDELIENGYLKEVCK